MPTSETRSDPRDYLQRVGGIALIINAVRQLLCSNVSSWKRNWRRISVLLSCMRSSVTICHYAKLSLLNQLARFHRAGAIVSLNGANRFQQYLRIAETWWKCIEARLRRFLVSALCEPIDSDSFRLTLTITLTLTMTLTLFSLVSNKCMKQNSYNERITVKED
jgi:hypothetical protein